ncbi:winged helix-turn-helix transcriptional regulator [Methanolobus sp. ZRKC3]
MLCQLKEEVLRYRNLQQTLPDIPTRMFTKQLRELEKDGLIRR